MIPFVVVLFTLMFVGSGMAVDFMRHEMARADLQNALDRGVLAATDMEQTLSTTPEQAKALILDYMKSRSYKAPELKVNVSMPTINGGRVINASAEYELNTFFLGIMGIDTIEVPAITQAAQAANKVEISLILDVSGSMSEDSSWTNGTRLTDLQTAAKDFIDTVLTDDNRDRTAISIIPYSAQVNLPDNMAAAYNISRHHSYGNCVNFSPLEYQNKDISTSAPIPQTQHFYDHAYTQTYWTTITTWQWRYTYYGWRQVPVRQWVQRTRDVLANQICPGTANQILPYSNDNTALKDAIDDLEYEGWTAAYTGMKWGVGLLDPSARPMVNQLIGNGDISADFRDWPADWTDTRTRKIIVLMTDGRNTKQYRVNASGYASQSPSYWNENIVPSYWLEYEVDNDVDGLGDDYLEDICTAAKGGANAIVYTIGFELQTSPTAATAMSNCASSPSTHYLVEGVNIGLAFKNIAAQIENLKLTN